MQAAIRRHLARTGIGLFVVVVFLGHAADYHSLPLIRTLEAIYYDTRLRLTMPGTVDSRIVILDIDEKSLAEKDQGGEGRWPWPRDRLALLVDTLFDRYEVAIVGFDVQFSERDESSGIRVLERLAERELKEVSQFRSVLRQIRPQLDYDGIFARKLKDRRVVLGYAFSEDEAQRAPRKGLLPRPVFSKEAFASRPIYTERYHGYTANLGELQRNAAGAGHINSRNDDDGIIRRVPMLAEFDGGYYEPLALAMVRVLYGSPPLKPVLPDEAYTPRDYRGLEWLEVGSRRIPLDEKASALVPFRGPKNSFNYIPLVDVLNQRADPADLRGKIVLIGTTAPGLLDLRATPVDPVYPGVEIHANLIAGVLDGNIKQEPPYVKAVEFLLLLISGFAVALLLPLLSSLASTLTTLLVLLSLLAANVLAYVAGNLVLPLASVLVMVFVLFTFNMAYGFFIEERGLRQITGLFGQYVPPELVARMAEDPKRFSMAPRAEELSVLFSDVRGFTTISESLSPEDLAAYINDYLTSMSLVIRERHRGTLDKYIGDAIMAFWGAPVADPDHARNAVLAALEMQRAAAALNKTFSARSWPTFRIGIGVNSGVMRVGDMGSRIRRAYTVMGDAVNIASRLEGITKYYGADIIVGEGTKNLISGFVLREIDRVRVKGKDEPVAIYEPLGLEGQVDRATLDEITLWNQSLMLYRQQEWDMAERQLVTLRERAPGSGLYGLFIERIAQFRVHPPGAGWDGASTFETK